MINWIRDNLGLKNILFLVLVLLVIAGMIKGPSWYKRITGSKYKGIAEATVTDIVDKKSEVQHLTGTYTKTVGYDIIYIYEVENEKFSNTEFVEPDKNIAQICNHFNSVKTCRVEIRYSLETPSKSHIVKLILSK